jgi:hypothetical protein
MAGKIYFSPTYETTINKAVFINQDIYVCPKDAPLPDNITEVVKFLFGEGASIEQDVVNRSACIRIKGASYTLSGVRTVNADWTYREIKE